MATSSADSDPNHPQPAIWVRVLFWVYDRFFSGGAYELIRNWMILGIGVLTLLSELAPAVFKTVFLMIILLPVILAALVVKVVPIAASAIGWGERLGLMATDNRISLIAQAIRLVSGGEDVLEHLIELFRR